MAIDIQREMVRTFAEVAKRLPKRRRGRPVNVATLYRWSKSGLKGVRLETIQIGGCACTSDEALQRFFDRLTAAANPSCVSATPAARQRAMDAAERELDEVGI